MIRKATPDDIPAIVRLGLQALAEDKPERLVIAPDRVRAVALECVSSARNFAWVAEVDGEVRGAVCAQVGDCMFYERQAATVVQFYAREAPGEGAKLIRQFLRWARARPAIKVVMFTLEWNADPRIGKLLGHMGLKTALPVYMEVR